MNLVRSLVVVLLAGGTALAEENPLVPASAGFSQVLDRVKDPARDPLPADPKLAELVKRGYDIFTHTPENAPRLVGNTMSCRNCHLNAGQKEAAVPLVGVAAAYPEYNKRVARLFSLEDRITACFMRSLNSANRKPKAGVLRHENGEPYPGTGDPEVLAVAAYLTWISEGYPLHGKLRWRGKNHIAEENLIPVEQLDPLQGKALFEEKCIACHGADGQGVDIGEFRAGPLWGKNSWNEGASAARVHDLAGLFRWSMPYLNPGSLTDEEAQLIAAYINSHDRPGFPGTTSDYLEQKVPDDAVYDKRKFKSHPYKGKLKAAR
jgi:thiosulfate dehydrogenase